MRQIPTYIALVLALVLIGACGRNEGATAPANPPVETGQALPVDQATPTPPAGAVAYIEQGDLWVKPLPDGPAQRLTSDGKASSPRWSPSGQWLAYCGDEKLWVVRSSGADGRALGPCGGEWLPNADRLAYQSDTGGTVVVQAGTWEEQQLPKSSAAWSPDGSAFAYVDLALTGTVDAANAPERATSLWRAQADGSETTELLNPGTPAPYGIIIAGWYADLILFWPQQSFSASLLADGAPLQALLAQGGQPREIAPVMLVHPDFLAASPDGAALALTEGGGRETWTGKGIVVVDLKSGRRTPLTDQNTAAFSPAWSPDGQRIAYVAAPDIGTVDNDDEARTGAARRRIWIMNRDGTNKQQLTADEAYRDERPRWSADGQTLVFTRLDQNDQASLWAMGADGSGPAQITPDLGPVKSDGPVWSGYYGYIGWDRFFDVWPGPRAEERPLRG